MTHSRFVFHPEGETERGAAAWSFRDYSEERP